MAKESERERERESERERERERERRRLWQKRCTAVAVRQVTHMNASCHTYGWVMPHIWISLVTHMNESCHAYECVMSHIWMGHATHMNESCQTYECVMSHIWMSHVTHMNASCHTCEWVMPPWQKRRTETCSQSKETYLCDNVWKRDLCMWQCVKKSVTLKAAPAKVYKKHQVCLCARVREKET